MALRNLGRVASESGPKAKAIEYLVESLRVFGSLNDRWSFAWSLLRLAIVVRDLRRPDRAAKLFGVTGAMMADFHGRLFNWDHPDFIKDTLAQAHALRML